MTELWPAAHTSDGGRPHRVLSSDAVVVRRRINARPDQVRLALCDPHLVGILELGNLGAAGWFDLTLRPEPTGRGSLIGRGRARLHGSGFRIVPYTRIDIEIATWSRTSCEVSVHPVARAPLRWGARRLRRYFELGPRLADHLSAVLGAPTNRPSSSAGARTMPGDRTIVGRSAA